MRRIALSLALVALAGCGGSAGEKPILTLFAPPILQQTVENLDPQPGAGAPNEIGDRAANGRLARLVMRFDISGLPPGAIIVAATLLMDQTGVAGAPYTDLSPSIQVDRVSLTDPFDLDDYGSVPLQAVVATLTPSTTTLETKTANVTTSVQLDVDQSFQVTELRLYFPSDTDGNFDDDLATFGVGNTAALRIEYREP